MTEQHQASTSRPGAPPTIGKVAGETGEGGVGAEQSWRAALRDESNPRGVRGDTALKERRQRGGSRAEEDSGGPMARGSGSGRWSRQKMGFLNTLLRCNLPPDTQKVVVFLIMMLLIIINVVLMFLLAFQ